MAQTRILRSRTGLDAGGSRKGLRLTLEDGVIASIMAEDAADLPDTILMPALVNAHDHARPMRNSSVGGFGKPLEIWLHRLALLAPVDPYLAALAPLARAALGGQGAVMVHCVRPQGLTDLPTEAAEVARAARDVGLRIAFGVGMRDQNPLVYGRPSRCWRCWSLSCRGRDRRTLSGPDAAFRQPIGAGRCCRSCCRRARWSMCNMHPTARNGSQNRSGAPSPRRRR